MTHRPPTFARELLDRIAAAKDDRDRNMHIARMTALEDAKSHLIGVPIDDSVFQMYMDAVERLDKLIVDMEAQLPCAEFVQRFGWWMHEEYHERYPIGVKTQLRKYPVGGAGIYYPVVFPTMFTQSPTIQTETRLARWERWRSSDPEAPIVYLAYNDVQNIVYVGE